MDTFFWDLVVIGDDVFALTNVGDEHRVLRSSDNSQTWVDASNGLPDVLESLAVIGDRLFVIGTDWNTVDTYVYRSADHGDEWQPIGQETVDLYDSMGLAVNGISLFAYGAEGIYRSKDLGNNWARVSSDNTMAQIGL